MPCSCFSSVQLPFVFLWQKVARRSSFPRKGAEPCWVVASNPGRLHPETYGTPFVR